jgi:histidinol-phosphate aminotransferase
MRIRPYQPGRPLEEVKREFGLKKIIKLASNENPLGPSAKAIQAIRDCAYQIYFYPDGSGRELKEALAQKLSLDSQNIILGNGSDEIVSMIARLFLRRGDNAIMATPSFLMYEIGANLSRARIISVPLKGFKIDLERMICAVTPKTRVVFIANPNNPTGTIVKGKEVDRFVSQLPENILAVFDEAYHEYVEAEDFPQTLDLVRNHPNIVVLRTFSKIYGLAGLRIGYGVAGKEIIDILNRARPPFNVNFLAQVAAIASLADQEQVRRSRQLIREEKKFLYSQLRKLKLFFVPTEANFILIEVGTRAKEVEHKLLEKGVVVRGMQVYDLPQFIRVSIGTREQNKEFIGELETILSS